MTKSKQGSPQWVALAEALEEFWDAYFFSGLNEFKNSKNLFTASEAHLNQKIAEYGDYFDTALPIDTSGKRLSISWQRANIHEKDTIVPFVSSLNVNFAGLGVTWEPLYSNANQAYARDNLFTEAQVKLKQWDLADFWMTSRGRIAVDLTHLHQLGMSKETFIAIAQREIERLRPSHIVYDGEYFVLTINFDYGQLGFDVQRQTIGESGGSMFYRLTASFDERPSDVPWLDESPLYVAHSRGVNTSHAHFALGADWSLDLFVDSVPIPGVDGDKLPPFKQHCSQIRSFSAHIVASSTKQKRSTFSSGPIAYRASLECHYRNFSLPSFELKQPISINNNSWLGFDEIPADFAPLDTPLWN
nr:hypothetical protein [Vibrio anguillarum]